MKQSEIFDLWAPAQALWSPWAKPVLFAHMDGTEITPAEYNVNYGELLSLPASRENSVLILDLPGASGVAVGLAMAEQGYRPVPLYNAVPGPLYVAFDQTMVSNSVVNVRPIMNALEHGAEKLHPLKLPYDAPPVFLLDANRRSGEGVPTPGRFDNRSISFVTDFPSANFLLAQNIRQVVLVQATDTQPQADLAHTLLRWQEAGIIIKSKALDVIGEPSVCTVTRPSMYRQFWYSLLASFGLRRNPLGGFGGLIPIPSAG